MTFPIFDTHQAVKDLEEAGFEESQAEAVVGMMSRAIGENVATRSDLQGMETNLQSDIVNQEGRITARMESLEERMTARMESLEERMTARMESLEHRMTIKLGAFVFAGAGAVVALLKFLS